MISWTPDRIALLRDLLADPEMEVAAIAERLGVPPSTIYAARARFGLARRTRQGGAHGRVRRAPGGFPVLAGAEDDAANPAGPLLPVLARPCGCRWPLWPDFTRPAAPRFCDAPVTGGSAYCLEHRQLSRRTRGEPWRRLPPPTLLGRLLLAA